MKRLILAVGMIGCVSMVSAASRSCSLRRCSWYGLDDRRGKFDLCLRGGVGLNQIEAITATRASGSSRPKVLGDYSVPEGWPGPKAEASNNTPGVPLQFDDPVGNNDAHAGAGFVTDHQQENDHFYFHSDHLGSTSYLTDNDGNVSQFVCYIPYGETLVDEHITSVDSILHNGAYRTKYLFNGKELDSETGLYYYGARYFEPKVILWYGVDPLTEGKPFVSGFVYCLGNPTRFVDPDGRWEEDEDGNLVAQKDDNIKTLAEYLNTSEEFAASILQDQAYIDQKGKLTLKEGDVLQVESDEPSSNERESLGFLGNQIRNKAGSNFSKDLFENYWNGNGDKELTDKEFLGILLFLKKNGTSTGNSTDVNLIDDDGSSAPGYVKVVSFYNSKKYALAFGSASIYYDSNNRVVGFYDRYDFDKKDWGSRSVSNEIKTRMVNNVSPSNARAFSIRYGYSQR